MKPAARSAIAITFVLLLLALLNPPWIDTLTKRSLGFHFISGSSATSASIMGAQIDYAKLILIGLSVCAATVAAYFIGTFRVTHGSIAGLKYVLHSGFSYLKHIFKPLASFFSWLEGAWMWIIIAGAIVKLALLAR